MAILAAVFFGFVPMLLFAAFVYWLDRYEKEPRILLGTAFLWGVIVAAGGAFIINTIFDLMCTLLLNSADSGSFNIELIG